MMSINQVEAKVSKDTLKLALEALEYPLKQSNENFNVDMAELISHRAITALRQAIIKESSDSVLREQAQNYPLECQTKAEKTAFAFGWWKALEANRIEQAQKQEHIQKLEELGWCSEAINKANTPQRQPLTDAALYLQDLVNALDNAFISSWQSTHHWQKQLDDARDYLAAHGIKGEA